MDSGGSFQVGDSIIAVATVSVDPCGVGRGWCVMVVVDLSVIAVVKWQCRYWSRPGRRGLALLAA